jgi:hypothetical protein
MRMTGRWAGGRAPSSTWTASQAATLVTKTPDLFCNEEEKDIFYWGLARTDEKYILRARCLYSCSISTASPHARNISTHLHTPHVVRAMQV